MKSWERWIHAFAFAVVFFFSASSTPSAVAQDVGAETGAVQAYVDRTREISNADYRVDRQPDRDNLRVYRVTISPDVAGFIPAERVFDVSVSEDGAQVLGESAVKLTD